MLWAWVGLIWLWIKNKGRKNFVQLKYENPDYEQTGVDTLWNLILGTLLIAFFNLVIYGIYKLIQLI